MVAKLATVEVRMVPTHSVMIKSTLTRSEKRQNRHIFTIDLRKKERKKERKKFLDRPSINSKYVTNYFDPILTITDRMGWFHSYGEVFSAVTHLVTSSMKTHHNSMGIKPPEK